MKQVLVVAAVAEAGMGLALLIAPSFIGRLLLGEELTGLALPIARVAGIALLGLCIACWPGTPRVGMLVYVAASAIYLAYLGLVGVAGILLWPAVIVHGILVAFLARASMSAKDGHST